MNNNQTKPTNQSKPNCFHLKTWQWLSVLIIAAVIAGGVFVFWNRQSQVSTQTEVISLSQTDLNYCKSDDGCIIVETIEGLNFIPSIEDECGCQCVTSINTQFKELWAQKKKEFKGKLKCDKLCKMCAFSMTNSKSVCENNQCVVKAISRIGEGGIKKGISITTDKTEYKQGETVKVTLTNNLDNISLYIENIQQMVEGVADLEKKTEKGWKKMSLFIVADIFPVKELLTGENYIYEWDQSVFLEGTTITNSKALPGIYRFKFTFDQIGSVYSNEFEIREKVSQALNKYLYLEISEKITPEIGVKVDFPPGFRFQPDSGILETGGKGFEINDQLVAVVGHRAEMQEPGGGGGGDLYPIYKIPTSELDIYTLSDLGSEGEIRLNYRGRKVALKPQEEWKDKFQSKWMNQKATIRAVIKNYGFQDKTKIKLPENYCQKDEDCVLDYYGENNCCAGCSAATISKTRWENRRMWREENCNDPCSEPECEIFLQEKAVCENNVCKKILIQEAEKESEKCANNSECQTIDCSKYDTPEKGGFKPYCVDSKCKCMCYGCK